MISLSECHDQAEEALIEEFEDAHHQGSISRMRKCADTLLPFKVLNNTVHSFIHSFINVNIYYH